jgi:predicted 2-oxoglutarate/Fe(II)-dependent dioxygenase YbiX
MDAASDRTLACNWLAHDIGTIDGFLSPAECAAYVQHGETLGYEEAPISTERGAVIMKDVRNNDRVILDDPGRAEQLWRRVAPFMPVRFQKKWRPVGVNERFRFYRYDVGQQFDWHLDGYFERANGERSFFTFMIYLNEDFEGGETSFSNHGSMVRAFDRFSVRPRTGTALLFHHPVSHKGEPVMLGRKYVLRTDVMFARWLQAV